MNEVGRPTEEEFDRLEELVEQYFVGDKWAVEIRCWDDSDVHLIAYSTIGTNCTEGYPVEVMYHRQNIIYKREDDICYYSNKIRTMDNRPNRELNRIYLEW